MVFGKRDKKPDKTTIIYNSHITLAGIPLGAYEYVVNGKSAIEWIMERYQIAKDKDSGIVNDPNDWVVEHDDPEYILRLLKSIITVSIETMKIVERLPKLNEK
jgi:predicted helicase